MKKIKEYVEKIEDELSGAKEYAEKALWYKAKGNATRYSKYKEMALTELGHAEAIHTFAVEDIETLKETFPVPPQRMTDKWEKSHADFIEKTAWIKQMLAM